MTAAIAYRSPLGRVRCYDGSGRLTLALEPGAEADVTWEMLEPEIKQDKPATWVDRVVEIEKKQVENRIETIPMTTGVTEMNEEKKPGTKAKKTERMTAARKVEERLARVVVEIKGALEKLTVSQNAIEQEAAVKILEKAIVIAEDGDLMAWYESQLGV